MSDVGDQQVSIKAVIVAAALLTQVGNVAYDRITSEYVNGNKPVTVEQLENVKDIVVQLRLKYDKHESEMDKRLYKLEYDMWETRRDCLDVAKDCKRLEKRIETPYK